jgi:polar amino acid transport system substrate-binding protein
MSKTLSAALGVAVLALALAVSACGGSDESSNDLLASIEDKGVLTVSTDPAYPPASEFNKETNEYEGFDIEVATEIAKRMGVDIAWETPAWDTITAGNWNGRWDISVGSMTITPERSEVLYFTPPYYYTPASVAVNADNTSITEPSQLSGKKVGVGGSTTYDFYLQNTLSIQDQNGNTQKVESVITDPTIKSYDTDTTALQDLSLGDGRRLDGAISATPIIQGAIDAKSPIKIIGQPLYYEPLAVAIDRGTTLDPQSLLDRISEIIREMHDDGTLAQLSQKWYGIDYTVAT